MWITMLVSVIEYACIAAIMLMLPRVTRRGLLFGVYVGGELARGERARRITRSWYQCMAATILISVAAGVSLYVTGRVRFALFLPDLILLLGMGRCYYAAHSEASEMEAARGPASQAPPPAVASLSPSRPGLALPLLVTFLGAALGLMAVWYAWSNYEALPDRVPTHFSGSGAPDAWSDKSFGSVMALPLGTLFTGVGMGILACFLAGAKRALRLKDKGISLAAQERFKTAIVVLICGDALFVTGMLGAMSFDSVRVGLGLAEKMSPLVIYLAVALVVFTFAAIVYIAKRVGQGGAKLEASVADLPLTNGLADNTKWKLGTIYYNREDPSMFVEHRFGIGYTLNFGNSKGVAFLVIFFLLVAVLPIVLALAQ